MQLQEILHQKSVILQTNTFSETGLAPLKQRTLKQISSFLCYHHCQPIASEFNAEVEGQLAQDCTSCVPKSVRMCRDGHCCSFIKATRKSSNPFKKLSPNLLKIFSMCRQAPKAEEDRCKVPFRQFIQTKIDLHSFEKVCS